MNIDNTARISTSDGSSPLLSVKEFALKHKWAVGGLRSLIFLQPNGFEKVVRRVGRKVLLHERLFFEWVEDINTDKKTQVKGDRRG